MAQAEVKRMSEIIKALKRAYTEARCSLDYKTPFQLLVATILSAQCTDERVNRVTPVLFAKYERPEDLAQADISQIEKLIRSIGFFHNKALAIKECAREITSKYGGRVPASLEKLTQLRGVGRKTANVVLANAFDVPAIAVDTHVKRVTFRLGFSSSDDPEKIEQELMKLVPRKEWTIFSHLLIHHGRAICVARRPLCEECPVTQWCPKIGVPLSNFR
jgi:endonuclease III